MGMELSKEVKNLVDGPNFGQLATLMPDGSPESAPVWLGREGDFILVITEGSSLRGKNTLHDPRVSLSIVDFHDPYREAQVRGRVVERRPDAKLRRILEKSILVSPGPTVTRENRSFS